MGAVVENMQLIVKTEIAVFLGNGQRTKAGEHILRGGGNKDGRRVPGDLRNQIKFCRVLICDFLLTGQQLQHKVCAGNIGSGSGGVAQNHGIGLVFSQQACGQSQMTAGGEAAGDDFFRIDVPFLRMFPDIADDPGNFLQWSKPGSIKAGGIAQDKGMEASGGIGHGDGFSFGTGTIHIPAAGAYNDGGPFRVLAKAAIAVQDVSVKCCGGVIRQGHMKHIHKHLSLRERLLQIAAAQCF